MIIYALYCECHNPARVRYVGLTTNKITRRLWEHKYASREPRTPVNCWINAHGEAGVLAREIDKAETIEELRDRERFWIAHYREIGQADLNLAAGGEGPSGVKLSAEHIEAIRRANLGSTKSEETRRKLSKSLMGHEVPQYVRDKISNSNSGKVRAPEHLVAEQAVRDRRAKVKAKDVPTIRNLISQHVPFEEIASRYGVTAKYISGIARGRERARINDEGVYDPRLPKRRSPVPISNKMRPQLNKNGTLSDDDVRAIRTRIKENKDSYSKIASEYSVSATTVARIARGESYQWVPGGSDLRRYKVHSEEEVAAAIRMVVIDGVSMGGAEKRSALVPDRFLVSSGASSVPDYGTGLFRT